MKAIIKTARTITQAELDEVRELIPNIAFVVEEEDSLPVPTWNPYFKLVELDWKWLKSLFGRRQANIYCYVGTMEDRAKVHVTKYLGLYNLSDKDSIHDFWFFVPDKLDKRAKNNGFKTNFAWLFCHEYLHGLQHFAKERDSVHEIEKQGRLKEVLAEHTNVVMPPKAVTQKKYLDLLRALYELLKQISTSQFHRPFPQWDDISQPYLAHNPRLYPITGHHPGTDFRTPLNTPIEAPFDGEVVRSGYSPSLGYYAEFKFLDYYLVALHLRSLPGTGPRKKGEPIGFVGDTGHIQGIHSHLEGWNRRMDRSLLTSKEAIEKYTFDITQVIV